MLSAAGSPASGRRAGAQAIQEAEEKAAQGDLSFVTAESIDGLSYGLVGDGVTDNTATFQRLLARGNRTIHVAAGDYVTGKLVIPSNTVLILEPGVTIRDSGRLAEEDRFINIWGAEKSAFRDSAHA